jgi:ribosome-binding factor A
MPKDYSRTERVADLMRRELALLIQKDMQDPRLNLVTVTKVQLSRDLSYAKVYITQPFEDEKIIAEVIKVLNKASARLRYLLAHTIQLRIMPKLSFFYDRFLQESANLSALIDESVAQDERKHKE